MSIELPSPNFDRKCRPATYGAEFLLLLTGAVLCPCFRLEVLVQSCSNFDQNFDPRISISSVDPLRMGPNPCFADRRGTLSMFRVRNYFSRLLEFRSKFRSPNFDHKCRPATYGAESLFLLTGAVLFPCFRLHLVLILSWFRSCSGFWSSPSPRPCSWFEFTSRISCSNFLFKFVDLISCSNLWSLCPIVNLLVQIPFSITVNGYWRVLTSIYIYRYILE